MFSIRAHASYIKRDGCASKHPQSWTGVVEHDGKVIVLFHGAGSKKQALQMAQKSVERRTKGS